MRERRERSVPAAGASDCGRPRFRFRTRRDVMSATIALDRQQHTREEGTIFVRRTAGLYNLSGVEFTGWRSVEKDEILKLYMRSEAAIDARDEWSG